MRLFLADTCFDQLIKLPKAIQRKVVEFQKKFRQDSTMASIHLEPIKQFKDNALRTARIDQGYRAIIGVIGNDNYSLLYIDKHDDAYQWAMNKKFIWNTHTQSCQLIPMLEDNQTPASITPTNTHEHNTEYAFHNISNDKLLKIGVPEKLLTQVKTIQDFDNLDAMEKLLPTDAYENLFYLLDEGDIDKIIADIEEGLTQSASVEEQMLSNNNKRHFIEITDDDELEKIIEEGMDKWQIFLHPSQRKLVDSNYNGTIKVSGSAGTGKTVAALHRLKRLAQNPNANVLFTTYTNALRNNLVSIIQKLNIPNNKYTLNNIDKVLREVATTYSVLPIDYKVLDYMGDDKSKELWRDVLDLELSEFDENFLYDEYIDVLVYNNIKDIASYLKQSRVGRLKPLSRKQRMDVWKLMEKYIARKKEKKCVDRLELFNMVANYLNEHDIRPYTNIIADEFQDFSNPELRFIRSLVAENTNDLFLTGDPFQRIYNGRKMNFSAAGINVRGSRSKRLKVNYRTTEEIKKVAVSIVKGYNFDDFDGGIESIKGYVSLMHGAEPIYKMAQDNNQEVEIILDFINECLSNGIKEHEICITARSMQMMKELQDAMHIKKMNYKNLKNGSFTGSSDGITFCTFHSIKGLEFKVIIAMSINERTMPSVATTTVPFNTMDKVEKKEYLMSLRSLLYVAITRAQQLVLITGVGSKCDLLTKVVQS